MALSISIINIFQEGEVFMGLYVDENDATMTIRLIGTDGIAQVIYHKFVGMVAWEPPRT